MGTGEFPNSVRARVFEAKGYYRPIDEGGNTAFVGFTTPSGVIGRLDMSRIHSSGYNNETYIIGTEGTLHVGRFAGYPGAIPVGSGPATGRFMNYPGLSRCHILRVNIRSSSQI